MGAFDPDQLFDQLVALVESRVQWRVHSHVRSPFRADIPAHILAQTDSLGLAVSGGLDSMVLMHALADRGLNLHVLHAHHGLQAEADGWAAFVADAAATLDLRCSIGRLNISDGAGPEAAARAARYRWFSEALEPGTCVVTAHHASDQAETLLYRALRGGGARALAGMRAASVVHGCTVLRPLLKWTREELSGWARDRGIEWIDDPSNAQLTVDRNRLRHAVMPEFSPRWPDADRRLAATASQLAEDSDLLDALARNDAELAERFDAPSLLLDQCALDVTAVMSLDSARLRNLLRWWLRERHGVSVPRRRLERACGDLISGTARSGEIALSAGALRRHRDLLYFDPLYSCPEKGVPEPTPRRVSEPWDMTQPLDVPVAGLRLVPQPTTGKGLSRARVQAVLPDVRRADDRLRTAANAPRRSLKNLYQENAIPPWERGRVPVLRDPESPERVIGVPGLAWADDVTARQDEPGIVILVENR